MLNRWNNYWFKPSPKVNLGISRILIVLTQLFLLIFIKDMHNTFVRLVALPASMYDPLAVLHLMIWPFGWDARPALWVLDTVYWITLATGFCALVGFKTRFTLLAFTLGSLFMQAFLYSFGDLHHPQALMMLALCALSLAPSGAAWSVDDLLRRLSKSVKERKLLEFNLSNELDSFARWPLLLVQWMFALAYFSAAWAKLSAGGLDWMNGFTLQYYLLQDSLRWGKALGVWLSGQHLIAQLLSCGSMLFESTFFLAVWFPPLAFLYVPWSILLHIGIDLAMDAHFFEYYALYAVFVPWASIGPFLSKCFSLKKEGQCNPQIFFDGRCILCIRSMVFLSYFDLFKRLEFRDLNVHGTEWAATQPQVQLEDMYRQMYVSGANGQIYKGFFAFRRLIRYLPVFWLVGPLFYMPFSSYLGPYVYRFIASRRVGLGPCGSDACMIHPERISQ